MNSAISEINDFELTIIFQLIFEAYREAHTYIAYADCPLRIYRLCVVTQAKKICRMVK